MAILGCEPVGEGASLALRQVDQDVGHLGRLFRQVNPAYGIRLVFGFRQPFGLRIRSPIGKRVDGGALGIAFAAPQRVGMNRNEQGG